MENAEFFERVRAAYRERAAAQPQRFRVIDASRPLADVLGQVEAAVTAFLGQADSRGSASAGVRA